TGYIRIKTTPRNEEVAGGVSVVQGARIDVDIRTTDEEYQELAVLAMSIADVEEGSEAALKLTIENLGNVDTAPSSVEIEIQDLNKNPLQSIKLTDLELVPVSTRKDVYTNFSLNVNPGEYFAHVRVLKADNILREDDLVFRQLGTAVVTSPRLQVDGGFLSRIFGENLPLNIALLLFEALVVIVAVALVLRQKKYSQESMTRIKIAATLTFIVVALVSIVLLNSQPLGVVLGKSTTGSPLTGQMQAVQGISTEAGITYYPIYEKPDYESGVIYRAVEGETFEIVEDQGDWLKVTLPDSLVGWLSRLNVKQ
ncbi:SH3 domain-containing protein, partial [Candidatus Dojkabacteria bacterium]|nr:SH3 domain-containing protein [Candidatus Dojkabacteria bacterium]